MVIVLEGNSNPESDQLMELNNLSIEEHYNYYIEQNMDSKEAMKQVALDRHISKKDVYEKIKK